MRWLALSFVFVVCCLVKAGGQVESELISSSSDDDLLSTRTELVEEETTTIDPGPDPANPFKYYSEKQSKLIKAVSADVMEYIAPHFVKDIHELNISGDCTYGLLKFAFGLKKFRPWSIKMLDSWGKLPHGVLYGALSSLGNMAECKSVVAQEKKYNGKIDTFFTGKYCAINVKPHLYFPKPAKYDPRRYLKNYTDEIPLLKNVLGPDMNLAYFYFAHFRIGACVPHTCTIEDMNTLVRQLASIAALEIDVSWCEDSSSPPLTSTQKTVSVVLVCLFTLSAIGTALDVFPKLMRSARRTDGEKATFRQQNTVEQVAECFSVYSNMLKILNTETGPSTLRCVHGLRVITMAWIILGHTFFYKNFNLGSGFVEALALGKSVPFQMVFNVFPAVETFVTISGCVLTVNYLSRMEDRQGSFSYFRHIVRRWWRLTPAFVAVSFMMILLPLAGSGPLWNETLAPHANACQKSWWTNPLYIGPYIHRENMCLPHGWYLSSDFHYFLILPFIAYLLYKNASAGLVVLFGLASASVITVGVLLYVNQLTPIPLFIDMDPDHFNEYMNIIGYKPFTHLAPFCIGVVCGYVLFKEKRRRIHKALRVPIWIGVWAVQLVMVFGVRNWNAYEAPSVEVGVAYGALFRLIWSMCIAWTVYACATGNGGLINKILSFNAWIPLSRLTYLVYLVHPLIILGHTAYLREPFYITIPFTGYLYLGHLFSSYVAAFFLSATLESPFLALDRLVTKAYQDRFDPLGHHPSTKRKAPMESKPNPVFLESGIMAMNNTPKHMNGKINMAFDNAKL